MTAYDAAYQGIPGAFSEAAAREALPDGARLLPCATFEDVFAALADGRARRAVLPVENSVAGPVAPVVRLLAERPVAVEGEVTLRIAQALVVAPGASFETIRRVCSHPVALAQCTRFFARNPQFTPVEDFDTAGAVERVVRAGSPDEAAIGPRHAADVYGGVVLQDEIQDAYDNMTKFVVISRSDHG